MRLSVVSICLILCLPILSLATDTRAPSWKPVYRMGTQELSLDEIKYLILPQEKSKHFASAIEDFDSLYALYYGKPLEQLNVGKPKQSIEFKVDSAVGEGGAFEIVRKRSRVTISGANQAAWANAIYTICSDMMGARWYWSGPLGFEWAESRRAFFPNRPWAEQPGFVQRRLQPAGTDYANRNRLNNVYSFNHNLARIFNQDAFDQLPEVFSVVNGRRKVPTGSTNLDPQPNFANPLTVEVAAKAALEYFEKDPSRKSYSLSINDNVLFDTSEATESIVRPLNYFRNRPNYTDLVFGFMNRVAERVFDQAGAWETPNGEARYITALSYYWTEPAPSMPMHPRVMPVLTSDRAQWHDLDYRNQDKALIQDWANSGIERVATWDYYFGAPYLYPRQFNQWIDESLKHLSDCGVDVFFSQLPSFWGLDGAKAWLTAELLWNPQKDADQLLDEYYHNFFGEAADSLRAFYEAAEDHRNMAEGKANWIKLYKDESGIALFTDPVLLEMRTFLSNAAEQVEGDEVRMARVKVVSDAFQLTERYAQYDRARQKLAWMALRQDVGLETALVNFQDARDDFKDYLGWYLDSSDYAPNRRYIDLSQSDPEALAQGVISQKGNLKFVSSTKDSKLLHRAIEVRNFLSPPIPKLKDWYLDFRASEGFEIRASDYGRGDSGLRILNADIVSIFNRFSITPNNDYMLHMRADWRAGLDNRAYVQINWLDNEDRKLKSQVPLRFPIGESNGVLDIKLPVTAPVNAHYARVRIVVSRQYAEDFLDVSLLDFGALGSH